MKKLHLSNNRIALLDDCDTHLLNIKKPGWHFHKARKTNGYVAKMINNFDNKGKRKLVYLHHAIMGISNKKLEIDHINGNGLDNRRENLRFVTIRINQQNQYRHRGANKKSPGTVYIRRRNKWKSSIKIMGKIMHLGYFNTEQEAADKYREVADH